MVSIKLKLFAIIILFVLAVSLLLSNFVGPDSGMIYGLKRYQENIFLKMRSSPAQKADYMNFLLDERLKEMKKLVENKEYGYVLNASLRYSSLAGRLTEFIQANELAETASLKAKFTQQQKVFEDLFALCQKNDNTECKYIQDDANYLKIYSSQLK